MYMYLCLQSVCACMYLCVCESMICQCFDVIVHFLHVREIVRDTLEKRILHYMNIE